MTSVLEQDHRSTPSEILDYITQTYGPYFDPCPLHSKENCFAKGFEWPKERKTPIFINPPFSQLKKFVLLASDLYERAQYETVILLCGFQRKTLSSLYFRDRVIGKTQVVILPGTMCYGNHSKPANFTTALLIWNKQGKGTLKYCESLDPNIHF